VALWAEMNVVGAEEFRDGNAPALKDPLRVAQRGFAALPGTIHRQTVLRLARTWNRFSNWKHAMEVLVLPAPA